MTTMQAELERPASTCPPNLHVSVSCPASASPPLRERVEQKFFVGPRRATLAFALLWRTCRPDAEYPAGQVNSLYFDTPDLAEHTKSDAGDSTKDKIRIRWYGDEFDPHRTRGDGRSPSPGAANVAPAVRATDAAGAPAQTVRVWLELKSRRGFASTKHRTVVEVPSSALAFPALRNGIVPASLLLKTLAGFGFFPRGELRPVIAISYGRYRFVEPRSGFRISLDHRIRSSMVMPGIGCGERGLELPGVVVEVKGPVFDLPVALHALADIGSSWTRYSKYSSSLDGHAGAMGSVARLWPSGSIEANPGNSPRVGETVDTPRAESPRWEPRLVLEDEVQ
jgi:hypothetical protein